MHDGVARSVSRGRPTAKYPGEIPQGFGQYTMSVVILHTG